MSRHVYWYKSVVDVPMRSLSTKDNHEPQLKRHAWTQGLVTPIQHAFFCTSCVSQARLQPTLFHANGHRFPFEQLKENPIDSIHLSSALDRDRKVGVRHCIEASGRGVVYKVLSAESARTMSAEMRMRRWRHYACSGRTWAASGCSSANRPP